MTTELANKPKGDLAVANQVDDMFGGSGTFQLPIDAPLPQIKILRETPMFETPEGDTVKEITGHIIYWHHANQYYSTEYGDGEQGPPACASSDGLRPDGGEEPQAGPCRNCPLNQYGSAKDGKGKACQNTIRLYVLIDGEVIPCVMKAPPSSLGKKESLLKWLTNAPNVAAKAGVGTKYQPIKVSFKLHKKDFDSGFSASVIDLTTIRVLTPDSEEDLAYLKLLAKLYQDFTAHYLGRIANDVANEKSETVNSNAETEEVDDDDEIPI